MSAFHVFYLASGNTDFEQIKKKIIKIITGVSPDIAESRPAQITEDTDDLLSIWCDYFSLKIKNGGQSVDFKSEDYGMKFQYQFWFDAYTSVPNWFETILSFVGKLMKEYEGECVFESNGDAPLFMRKDNIVVVDDRRMNGMQKIPFEELGIEYQVGELKV